jgi:hypothetical protein
MDKFNTHVMVSEYLSWENKSEISGEIADSRCDLWNARHEPRTSFGYKSKGIVNDY